MLHTISRRHQTLRRTVLTRDENGAVTRRRRLTLTDVFKRIDEHLEEL